jgi:hypothetical protein
LSKFPLCVLRCIRVRHLLLSRPTPEKRFCRSACRAPVVSGSEFNNSKIKRKRRVSARGTSCVSRTSPDSSDACTPRDTHDMTPDLSLARRSMHASTRINDATWQPVQAEMHASTGETQRPPRDGADSRTTRCHAAAVRAPVRTRTGFSRRWRSGGRHSTRVFSRGLDGSSIACLLRHLASDK